MSKSNKHIDLFTNSGCLTTEALKGYVFEALSELENDQLKGHLDSCELCSDALEGYKLMSDQGKLDSIVSEINEDLKVMHAEGAKITHTPKFKLQTRLYYFAAAASVLILIGFYFYLQNYISKESTSQSVSQVIDLDKKSIPPMPKAKFQEIVTNPEGISQQKSEEAEPTQKERPKQQIKKESTIQVTTIKQPLIQKNEEEVIAYVPPLKAVRAPESIPKSLGSQDRITDVEETLEPVEYEVVDIASTQPIEYYIGGVIVYDRTNEKLGLVSSSAKSSAKSGKGSRHKSMDVMPQTIASESKKEMDDAVMEQNLDQEQQKFENESALADENHFFSLGNKVPQFPGGYEALIEYLMSNLNYPKDAKQMGLQGQIVVSFLIEENGEVSSPTIIRGIGGGCNEEALRVIKQMPSWRPAYKDGEPVRILFNMPITFRLN